MSTLSTCTAMDFKQLQSPRSTLVNTFPSKYVHVAWEHKCIVNTVDLKLGLKLFVELGFRL